MRISNGVEMLEIKIDSPQGVITFNPTLIWDEVSAVLVDTGMPGQWEQIRSAIIQAGVPIDHLKEVIITHQDLDHIGGIADILQEKPDIKIYAHELDQPYIEGERPLIKTDISKMSKEMLDFIPKEIRAIYENPPKANVDHILVDGEKLPFGGGIEVIFTPGHTPGHISLYLKESKTLVAADALVYHKDKLQGPVPQATLDIEEGIRSIRKFLNYDIKHVICYHGGHCSDDIKEQIEGIM